MSSASSMARRNSALTANRNSSNNNGPLLKPQLLPHTSAGKKSTSAHPIKPIKSSPSFYNGYGSGPMPRKPGDRGQPSSQRSFPHADRPAPAYCPPDMSSIGTSVSATAQPSTPRERRKQLVEGDMSSIGTSVSATAQPSTPRERRKQLVEGDVSSIGTSVSATAQPSTPRERRKQLVEGERQSRSTDTVNVTRRPRSKSADRLGGSHTSAQQQNYNKSYCDHEQVYKTEKRESRSRERNATPRSKSYSTDRGATTPRLDRVQHKAQESSRTAAESGVTNTVQKMSLTASNAQQKSTKETQRGFYSHDTGNSALGYPLASSHGTTSSRQHQSLHDNTGTGYRSSSSELVAVAQVPSPEAPQSHHTSIRNSAPVLAGPIRESRVLNDRVTGDE